MRDAEADGELFVGKGRELGRYAEHDVGLLNVLEFTGKYFRIAPHVEKSVDFPMNVGHRGENVSADGGVCPDRLDLVLDGEKLMLLAIAREVVVVAKNRDQIIGAEA